MFAIKKVHLKECGSTQDESFLRISTLKEDDLLVLDADFQTKGRGRLKGREWRSSKGLGILVTFTFKMANTTSVTQLLDLSCIAVLEKIGFPARIKWPNDLVLHGKKLGGVLAEVKEGWTLLGLGLNVNAESEDLDIGRPATSLKIEGERALDKELLLETITDEFAKNLSIYKEKGFSPFVETYKEKLVHKTGDLLSIDGKNYPFEGVREDGSLKAGRRIFYSAEITS